MLEEYLPIYPDCCFGNEAVLTLDGRIGKLYRAQDRREAAELFEELVKKRREATVSFQDFFGDWLLCLSWYLYPTKPTRIQNLFLSTKKIKEDAEMILSEFEKVESELKIRPVEYPTFIGVTESHHTYRLKKKLTFEELKSSEVLYRPDGFGAFYSPFSQKIRNLYVSRWKLQEMLQSGLLTIEYVDQFRKKAIYLWLPLGYNFYLAELFKL